MLAEIIDHVEEGVLLLIGIEVRWLNPAARLMFPAIEHPVGRSLVEVGDESDARLIVPKDDAVGDQTRIALR